jgi:hypothetical protein
MDKCDARASDFRVRIHDGSGSLQQFDVPLLFLNLYHYFGFDPKATRYIYLTDQKPIHKHPTFAQVHFGAHDY